MSKAREMSKAGEMNKAHVFVVGSLHYDIVLNAPHLPARDETVMGENVQFVCGGKGGNQAVAASSHGAKVSFAGAVGKDFFADALLEHLANAGVETSQIAQSGAMASGMSVAIVDPNGDYGAVVASGSNQNIQANGISLPADTGLLLLQNEIPEPVNMHIANRAREAGAKVILNAAPMRGLSEALLGLVDVLIVNRVEAEALFDQPLPTTNDALAVLKDHDLPCPTVVVTLGAEGLVFATVETGPQHLRAQEVETISSHGAGDAFVGALSARLVFGDGLPDALSYASVAAALHVSTPVEERHGIDCNAVVKHQSGKSS